MPDLDTCPITVTTGEDLTKSVIDNFTDFLDELGIAEFKTFLQDKVKKLGPITRIEEEGFPCGITGYVSKSYWLGSNTDPDHPDLVLPPKWFGLSFFPA